MKVSLQCTVNFSEFRLSSFYLPSQTLTSGSQPCQLHWPKQGNNCFWHSNKQVELNLQSFEQPVRSIKQESTQFIVSKWFLKINKNWQTLFSYSQTSALGQTAAAFVWLKTSQVLNKKRIEVVSLADFSVRPEYSLLFELHVLTEISATSWREVHVSITSTAKSLIPDMLVYLYLTTKIAG